MYKLIAVNELPVLVGTVLLLGAAPARSGNPAYLSVYRASPGSVWYAPPPSYFGYHLDEYAAGYYGGGRYREYYAYGRGVGLADYPGPLAWPGVPPDYRGPRRRAFVEPLAPVPVEGLAAGPACVSILMSVPADAEVWLDGIKTNQTGPSRHFESPALRPGGTFTYEVRARWTEQGRNVEQSQLVLVRSGDQVRVDFPALPQRAQSAAPRPFPLAAGQAGRVVPSEQRELSQNP